jgi:hypoxanthine phosphoribosyltransferase
MTKGLTEQYPRVIFSPEQIQARVRELGRRISDDYRGQTICVVGVLDSGFVFMADLVRHLDLPAFCQFLKIQATETASSTDISFNLAPQVEGQHVLLVEALVQSGVTTRFLLDSLARLGASTVRLAVLLDKQAQRRIDLQPDYFGFLINEDFVIGYGLGAPRLGRNLPYIAAKA